MSNLNIDGTPYHALLAILASKDPSTLVIGIDSIGVTDQNVVELYNEGATFDGILKGFEALGRGGDIKKGRSTIFIHFSGHGASKYKSVLPKEQERYWSGWDENVIKQILPQDAGRMPGSRSHGSCLAQQTIKEKSDNIILILDCCYSARMTRADDGGQEFETRTVLDPPSLSFSAEIWSRIPSICEADILTQH
ncbi:hypothetical protein F5146DRAFT_1122319 [Armillaria mellea]|nr:hypothetical protein F5146DRAFT_1122319 [Armillaria mellea]